MNLNFSKGNGLLPAIVQHRDTGEVLMLGYMNEIAFCETKAKGRVVFWSRSRARLWEKGETSGHTLTVDRIDIDCDHDTILIQALPIGPVCHLGTQSCFSAEPISAYRNLAFLNTLESIISERIKSADINSYTVRLYSQGIRRIAQKVGEEGLEVALAANSGESNEVINEAADLIYHLLVMLKGRDIKLCDVVSELSRRHIQKI